jgi:xanthine dehydrogenase YagR molybdenum-binding subunit
MYDNQVPENEIMARIKRDGISFQPDQKLLDQLPSWGVSPEVIEVIRTAQVKEGVKTAVRSPYKKANATTQGDPDKAFADPNAVVSEGTYGLPMITHCCLESHGAISHWKADNSMMVYISTQNVSGIADQMAEPLGVPASNITVHQDHVGGGFGSKFSPDRWGIASAQLSKKAGNKPVKLMLERDTELETAGARPSAYARVKVAATKDGTLTAWDSYSWSTGGVGGGGAPPIPYVWNIPNQRKQHTAVATNQGSARAWRAPSHPQSALITNAALEDLAAKLNMDPIEFFQKNIQITGPRAETYAEELNVAAELADWKKLWHPRSQLTPGTVKRGLGVSLHTWGGRGHESNCDLTIHPDGAVGIKMGSQDLGTGTRTAILMIAADTLGVPLEQIKLEIGDSRYPQSGGSGGSTTIGGVSSSTRRAAVDARDALFAKVAPALKAQPAELESVSGRIRVKGDANRSMGWKEACAKIGAVPLTVRGKNPDRSKPPDLTNSGVGGVQIADVSVDTETGIVTINKMVAVQDAGLYINHTTAESQILGALIMGISYSLYEEKVMDPVSGRMLNPNMEFYRLAGISDIGQLVVKLMTGPKYDGRGVIGLGEPPVISPGAAISTAVANAIGMRVPYLPLTPYRVLEALDQGNAAAAKGGVL